MASINENVFPNFNDSIMSNKAFDDNEGNTTDVSSSTGAGSLGSTVLNALVTRMRCIPLDNLPAKPPDSFDCSLVINPFRPLIIASSASSSASNAFVRARRAVSVRS